MPPVRPSSPPPTWCARLEQRLELVEAERVRGDELPINETVAMHNVGERVGQRRVRARERLQVDVRCSRCRRSDRIDNNHRSRCLGEPVLMLMRCRSRRVRTPDEDAARLGCCLRVEPVARRTVEVGERLVTGLVADRVRIDLGRSESMKEALWKCRPQQRAGAGVVRVQDRRGPLPGNDRTQPGRDLAQRLIPRDRFEAP